MGKGPKGVPITGFLYAACILLGFQFFGSALSFLNLPFSALILVSFWCSVLVSYLLLGFRHYRIPVYTRHFYIMIFASLLATVYFSIRINWNIFDTFCPTSLYGMVTQTAKGFFPASFLSFPEFVANYHQGFVFVSGVVSYLTLLWPPFAIKITMIVLFWLLFLILWFATIKLSSRLYAFPLLFLLTASFPWFHLDWGWYTYLNLMEYVTSNSWAFGYLGLGALLLIATYDSQKLTYRKIATLTFFTLCLSTANALAFQSTIIASILFAVYASIVTPSVWKRENRHLRGRYGLLVVLLGVAYVIASRIPSILLKGLEYGSPVIGWRLDFSMHGILEFFKYVQLGGFGVVVAIILVFVILLLGLITKQSWITRFSWGKSLSTRVFGHRSRRPKKKNSTIRGIVQELYASPNISLMYFLSLLMVFCFLFPLVFKFENISYWDNYHKFVIMSMLVSVPVLSVMLSKLASYHKYAIGIFCVLMLIFASQSHYDLHVHRTSVDWTYKMYPQPEQTDIVLHLYGLDQKVVLLPYGPHDGCDDFSQIASFSGTYLKDTYYTNFLLSDSVEQDYVDNRLDWTSLESIKYHLDQMDSNEAVIVRNSEGLELVRAVKQLYPDDPFEYQIFARYTLISTKD